MQFSQLKKGDKIVEQEYGMSCSSTVETDPVKNGDQWSFKAKTEDGQIIDYMQTEGLTHYGPNVQRDFSA